MGPKVYPAPPSAATAGAWRTPRSSTEATDAAGLRGGGGSETAAFEPAAARGAMAPAGGLLRRFGGAGEEAGEEAGVFGGEAELGGERCERRSLAAGDAQAARASSSEVVGDGVASAGRWWRQCCVGCLVRDWHGL